MPSAKSTRVSTRRRRYNAPIRTRAKTNITKARKLIEDMDVAEAEKAVKEAVVALDKAAQKGAIHKGNAARRKGRLMHQLAQAKANAQAPKQ